MATCKECIHHKSCFNMALRCGYKAEALDGAETCEDFKNKADFVEVKHGKWIDDIQIITTVAGAEISGIVGYKCSLCGRREGSKEPYCNCGAIMDVPDTNDGKKGIEDVL